MSVVITQNPADRAYEIAKEMADIQDKQRAINADYIAVITPLTNRFNELSRELSMVLNGQQ